MVAGLQEVFFPQYLTHFLVFDRKFRWNMEISGGNISYSIKLNKNFEFLYC